MISRDKTTLIIGYPNAQSVDTVRALTRKKTDVRMLISSDDARHVEKSAFGAKKTVVMLKGSIDKIDLGLAGADYSSLAKKLTSIVYLSTPHIMGMDYVAIKSADFAVREIIELARMSPHLEHICVLSGIDVAGDHKGIFAERDLAVGQGFSSDAQRSRFKAEKIYRKFMNELPITILRVGQLVGDKEGACPLIKLLLSGVGQSKKRHLRRHRPFTLLDGLGEIIAALVSAPYDSRYSTLHLISGDSPMHNELENKVWSMARAIVPASFDLASGARRNLISSHEAWRAGEFFLQQNCEAVIKNSFTQTMLEQRGLKMPAFDDVALANLVDKAAEEIVGFK